MGEAHPEGKGKNYRTQPQARLRAALRILGASDPAPGPGRRRQRLGGLLDGETSPGRPCGPTSVCLTLPGSFFPSDGNLHFFRLNNSSDVREKNVHQLKIHN